jgi:YidC/Oxa1 family membrane protein insertase
MDKRTLIFVISLSLTLFLVNMFFEQRNQVDLKEQHEQQKALKIEKRNALEVDIEKRTAKLEDLPLVKIYSDSSETHFLTSGVLLKNSLLTLPWAENLPEKVYADGQELKLVYNSQIGKGPVLYEKNPDDALPIADLPYFGSYELQLVTFYPNDATKKALITHATYIDGQFYVPIIALKKINEELGQPERSSKYHFPHDSIALLKTPKGYYPVGIYEQKTNSIIHLEQIEDLSTEVVKFTDETKTATPTEEQFFVIENNYHQLVFSNRGGALVEINLPFETETNNKSVVKEIGFDRDILEKHPFNALFPLHPYFTPGDKPEGPFNEHSKGRLGGYYPLIRRDLLKKGNRKSIHVLPEFYALNIVSEYPEMAELLYEVKNFDSKSITFEATQKNRRITKIYSVNPETKEAPYCLDLTIVVEGDSRGLWLTSGVPEVEIISNAPAPAMKYRITRKGRPEVNTIDQPGETTTVPAKHGDIFPDWVCNSNGFLGLILDPLSEIDPGFRAQYVPGTLVPSRLVQIDEEYEIYKAQDLPGYMVLLPLNSKGGTMKFRIFAGPFASNILKEVDKVYSNAETGYNPDYIASQSFHGWFAFISAPFAKFLLILMNFFHYITGSWAFSIILLTVALRIMLYPLNAWSTKSMLKMQQIAPEVTRIQEKYKKEPQKAQLQIMNLYRDKGVNPISGCFPLLIQMPFLIGMFDLLKSTFELRGASFIPGWIDNLAAPDVLFSWSTPIFFIGREFHLLPFFLGGVMFLQQLLMSPLPKDPSQMTDQQRQQKAMGTMMTVVFTIMFYHFPSGLNIYWLSSMLLGILQQWWMQRQLKPIPAGTTTLIVEPSKSDKKSKRR